MFRSLARFIADHYLTCTFKERTGLDCAGCGMQRSIVALLNGDVAASVNYYPATIPLLIMFGYLIFHLAFKSTNGAKALLILFSTNAFIIAANYLFRLMNVYH